MEDLNRVTSVLDELLGKSDLSGATAEGSKGGDLPDGYYLCEVEKAELTASKSSGNPMVKLQYKVVENGFKSVIDDQGNDILVEAKGTANRKIFLNYVLSTEQQVGFFVSDMLKFANPEDMSKPLLGDTPEEAKAYFKSSALLVDALDIISMGCRIYIMVQTVAKKDNPEEKDKKYNPITWARAAKLELPTL